MANISKTRYLQIFALFVLVGGLAAGLNLVRQKQEVQEGKAAFNIGATYTVGSLGGITYYRTSFATEEAPVYARSQTLPQGVYDYASNTTFITYGGGIKSNGYSAMDPFVIAYHHSNETWEGPVRIATTGAPADNHHYPQIVIDKQGYLHVFFTFHEPHNIIHAKSVRPRDMSSWSVKTIPNSTNNSYGAPFVDNQGEIYIFFRYGYYDSFNHPPYTNKMYEPEVYMKSADGGATWKGPVLVVDPGRPSEFDSDVTDIINDGGFNTVYTQDYLQDLQKNGVHFTFAVHKRGKPESIGHQYYVFFDFDNDRVYDAKGVNLGTSVDRPEYTTGGCCWIYLPQSGWASTVEDLDKYGNSVRQAIVLEDTSANHYPTIYYTHPDGGGKNHLFKAKWNGGSWNYSELTGTLGEPALIWDGEYRPGEGTFLYIKTKYGGTPPNYVTYQYPLRVFRSSTGWSNLRIFNDNKTWEVRGVSQFSLIPHAHPSIRATMIVPKYTETIQSTQDGDFTKTLPIGAHYVLGERDLTKYPGPTPIPLPTNTPTNTPTPKPTNTPTPSPTRTPTPSPTRTPTPTATHTATPSPTRTPTPSPTRTPTPKPTATNTPKPTATNTPKPNATSTPTPTSTNTPILLASDLNGDGHVNIGDYTILIQNFGSSSCGNIADITGDCKVNVFDYNLLLIDYGK